MISEDEYEVIVGQCGTVGCEDQQRDRLAEGWLTAQHTSEWYIGDATLAEWFAAYATVDGGFHDFHDGVMMYGRHPEFDTPIPKDDES